MMWFRRSTSLRTLSFLFLSLSQNSRAASSSSTITASSRSEASCVTQATNPPQLPILNVTLSDGTIRRGISFSVGTPFQPFAFRVDGGTNYSFIHDGTIPCNSSWSPAECSNYYGGLFDESSSSTWQSAQNLAALSLPNLNPGDSHSHDLWGTDNVKIDPNISLPSFPLGINRAANAANSLGLANNSTLLNTLLSGGSIASRTWGYFQGWMGAQTEYQTDGNLVLGGYDRAKFTGSNVTIPYAPQYQCGSGYLISVTDIKMNLKNGSNPSILGQSSGSAMRACVVPDADWMSISQDIWEGFTNISGSVETGRAVGPMNYWSMTVLADGAYDGDLTVTIYPGLDIRIPNHQLVVPNVDVNDQGQEYIKNETERNVLLLALRDPNANDMPAFGRPFMSSAYLFVDNDNSQFTIWKSQPNITQDLVAVGHQPCSSSPPMSVPSPSSSITSILSPANNPNPVISGGAIAGCVVGGLAALALFGIFFAVLRRRRAFRRQALSTEHEKTESDQSYYYKPEMPSDKQPPQEMPPGQDPGYGLAPLEMSPGTSHAPCELPGTRQPVEIGTQHAGDFL